MSSTSEYMLTADGVEFSPSDADRAPIQVIRRTSSHADLSKHKFKQKVEEVKIANARKSIEKKNANRYSAEDIHRHHHPWTFTFGLPHGDLHKSDKIYHFLHHKYVHLCFSFLLLIDIAIVIISISLELEYLHSKVSDCEDTVGLCQAALGAGGDPARCDAEELGKEEYIEVVEDLAVLSLTILCLFLAESLVLLMAKPRHFFSSPMYSLDLLVVAMSIVLELVFQNEPQGGLLVLARVWRFARIGHGVFEEAKPEEDQTALIETLRSIDEKGAISKAFRRNEQQESEHYELEAAVVDDLVGAVGAFLTFESE